MNIYVDGDGEMTMYSGKSGLQQLMLNMLQISVLELAEKESEMIDPEKLLEKYYESVPGFFTALMEGSDIWEYARMIVSKAKEESLHEQPIEECIIDEENKSYPNVNDKIRRTILSLSYIAKKVKYNDMPKELEEFSYWVSDLGYCLIAIPECFIPEVEQKKDPFLYEMPMPLNYVKEKGYRLYQGHLVVDAPCDRKLGLPIPEKYFTWTL